MGDAGFGSWRPSLGGEIARPLPAVAWFLAATLALRFIAIFALGFHDDEAYVIVISRTFDLGYYDHPPLHHWIVDAWRAAFGEGRAIRLPFLVCNLATTFAQFRLTRLLFDSHAAWWTAFAFNATPIFLCYPDGYVTPDAPLFALLALGVWAVAEILYGPERRATPLWLAAGLAFGLAGLTKYSAAFAPIGLAGFFLTSARARVWLRRPAPYAAAALGALCVIPPLVWNAEHHWASLAFQSGRAAQRLSFDLKALVGVLTVVRDQLGWITPWMLLPLVAGIARGFGGGADAPQRFLLWLALPPLVFFLLMPFYGQTPVYHWLNSGWLFAFPLAGRWLAGRTPRFLGRFFRLAGGFAVLALCGFMFAVLAGPFAPEGKTDFTRNMFDYPPQRLREIYARSGAGFVLISKYTVGARVGIALGPQVPVCAMGGDPRGFAFTCDAARRIGQDALIVRINDPKPHPEDAELFETVEPLGDAPVGRRGHTENVLTLALGRKLKRAPPLPYGP